MPESINNDDLNTKNRRVIPHDYEAEAAVLAGMLFDTEGMRTALEQLSADDFYMPANALIFNAISELFETGAGVDIITLRNKLTEQGNLEKCGGLDYLRSLPMAGTSANIADYCEIVRSKAQYRELIKLAEHVSEKCYSGEGTVDEVMADAEHGLFEMGKNIRNDDFTPMHKVIAETIDKIDLANKSTNHITGLATGFTDFDLKTAGFQPSDLILIAARPSMGKTAFALNIAQYAATRLHKTVAMFSLEMSRIQLATRMLSTESGVESSKLRSGGLTEDDFERLAFAMGVLGDSKIFIDDSSAVSPGDVRAKCAKLQLEWGLDLIVIDYLQLMNGGKRKFDSVQAEVAFISKSLKAIAREFNVPVIALSQLSRAVEKRDSKKPILSDLRESGSIEQDADVVCFLYRNYYYSKDEEERNKAQVIIAKQRNGGLADIDLIFHGEYTRFSNAEHIDQQDE
ncbi:MAG TPA: replicative DNA helicase [Lachnospiraceae bacterium]|nr:replicative DNA helicase [Lachnospiraceae bacterium]